jgi:O-antigen ligase
MFIQSYTKILSFLRKNEFFLLIFSLVLGVFLAIFSYGVNYSIAKIFALPIMFIMGVLLFLAKEQLLYCILLTRSICDPIFTLTKSGGGLGLGAGVNLLVIAITILYIFDKPKKLPLNYYYPWIFFISYSLYKTIFSPIPMDSFRELLVLITYASMFILPFFIIEDEKSFKKYIFAILISAIIPVLYSVVELLTSPGGTRLKSTFSHPNVFAFYMMLMLACCLVMMKSLSIVKKPNPKRIVLLMFGFIFALLMTKTRSAWLATVTIFALYSLFFERKFIIYMIIGLFLSLLIPEVRERLLDLEAGNHAAVGEKLNSYAWRLVLWKSSFVWIEKNPIFGYGLETFSHYSPEFFRLERVGYDAHNVYVQTTFELGLIGLISYVLIFINSLLKVLYLMSHDMAIGIITATLIGGYMMVAYSDNMQYYLAFNWYFWFYLGSVFAYLLYLKRVSDEKKLSLG